jgi:hypothetical protein
VGGKALITRTNTFVLLRKHGPDPSTALIPVVLIGASKSIHVKEGGRLSTVLSVVGAGSRRARDNKPPEGPPHTGSIQQNTRSPAAAGASTISLSVAIDS